MYKRIGSFNFSSFSFIPEIDSHFNTFAEKALSELTYSIFKKYILNNESTNFSESEITIIQSVIEETAYFEIDMHYNMALMLLSQILDIEMESYLKVPINEVENSRNNTPKLMFNEFMASEHKHSVDDLIPNEALINLDDSELEISEYPKYFRLYRAKNVVLSGFNQRIYSSKTLTNIVKNIYEEFKQGVYLLIIKENLRYFKSGNVESVINRVIEKYTSQILNNQRLGKTMEAGDKAVEEIKQVLNENNFNQIIFDEYKTEFEQNFSETIEVEFYTKLSEKIVIKIEKYLIDIGINSENVMIERFSDYKKIILGEIFRKSSNIEGLIEESCEKYTDILKWKTVKKILDDSLSICDFEIALRVHDLAIDEKFFKKHLTESIEVISHTLFKSWQYEKFEEINIQQEPTLIDVQEEKKVDSVWFIVKNIQCGKKDNELAYLLAKDKLTSYLEIIYYFVSKEGEYDFKVVDPYLIINKTIGSISLGRKESAYIQPKKVDDFTDELLKFLQKFLESENSISIDINNCIRLYFKMIKETDVVRKSRILVEIWETIFNTYDCKKLSMYCAIIIAGTNYNSNSVNITYKDMRKIMYEDFLEFIKVSRNGKCLLVLEEVLERFKVFTRNIIGTYLFNIDLDDSKEYNMINILQWILHINPSEDFIYKGESK